jgi:hypothetical protein
MGYQKGSITLSATQDIPLLLQVLHSRFITHDQLFEFMLLGCYELKRASFNWRVRRLVEVELLHKQCARPVTPSPVYSITSVGALMLAEHCPVLDSKRKGEDTSHGQIAHSIGLNDLHLSLARQGVLEDWQSEMTIRATNELTPSGYAKDYDAIVTVRIDGQPLFFALEYERTPKESKRYLRIRSMLEREYRVRHFLYIVPEPSLAFFILDCFARTTAALFVGLAADFTRSLKDMDVTAASSGKPQPIIEALFLSDGFAVSSPRLRRESSARQ